MAAGNKHIRPLQTCRIMPVMVAEAHTAMDTGPQHAEAHAILAQASAAADARNQPLFDALLARAEIIVAHILLVTIIRLSGRTDLHPDMFTAGFDRYGRFQMRMRPAAELEARFLADYSPMARALWRVRGAMPVRRTLLHLACRRLSRLIAKIERSRRRRARISATVRNAPWRNITRDTQAAPRRRGTPLAS